MASLEQQLKQSQAQKFRLEEQVEEVSRRLEDEIELKEQRRRISRTCPTSSSATPRSRLRSPPSRVTSGGEGQDPAGDRGGAPGSCAIRRRPGPSRERFVGRNRRQAKLEAEHNAKVSRLASEIDRLRDELEQRTNSMGNGTMRWKSQADAAANAVSLAKMRRWAPAGRHHQGEDGPPGEKLYIGREKGLSPRRHRLPPRASSHQLPIRARRRQAPGTRGGAALAAAPSGGASKPGRQGCLRQPAEDARGSMAGGNMFTPAHTSTAPAVAARPTVRGGRR